jgi:hypothetical protein
MVENAEYIILANIEPNAVAWLKDPLIAAAKRGVEVRIKVYEPVELPRVNTVLKHDGSQIYGKTNDVQINLCTDGKEMLTAVLTLDLKGVIQAFRSKSALMTLMLYNELLYELILTDLKRIIALGDIDKAQKILSETEHLHVFGNENIIFEHFNQRYKNLRK